MWNNSNYFVSTIVDCARVKFYGLKIRCCSGWTKLSSWHWHELHQEALRSLAKFGEVQVARKAAFAWRTADSKRVWLSRKVATLSILKGSSRSRVLWLMLGEYAFLSFLKQELSTINYLMKSYQLEGILWNCRTEWCHVYKRTCKLLTHLNIFIFNTQAFAATEAMTDRYCIAHKGKQFRFSADNLVSCCDECGSGCNGGFPSAAWEYWVETGIVSGGPYASNQVI